MMEMEYITIEDIKFDINNVYFSKNKDIEKRITTGLTKQEAGIYLYCIMSLEFSIEEEYILEDDEIFGILDLDDLYRYTTLSKIEFMNIFNSIIAKGYIEEVSIEGFEDYKTFLFLY